MTRSLMFMYATMTLVACSSPGSFSGSVQGHGLDVVSAAFGTTNASVATVAGSPNTSFGVAMVLLSSHKDVCSQVSNQHINAGDSVFFIGLTKLGGPVGVGTFNAMDPNTAAGNFSAFGSAALYGVSFAALVAENGQCGNAITDGAGTAVSGTVNVDDITPSSGGTTDGSFSLSLGTAKTAVSGSFSAPYCAGVSQFLANHFGSAGNPNTAPGLSFNTIPCQ